MFARSLLLLSGALLAAAATHAQTALPPAGQPAPPPVPAMPAVALDNVAVAGTTRLLTLGPETGEDLPVRSLTPGTKVAVFYQPPAGAHEYDLTAIRLRVSGSANRSNTGQVLISLVLPDSVTRAPSGRQLLPTPLLVTSQQVRRAKKGILLLDIAAQRLTLPAGGLFIVAEGTTSPPDVYLGDTLVVFSRKTTSRYACVKLGQPASGAASHMRVINATDFICLRDVRTTLEPQTWDYSRYYTTKVAAWRRRRASYPNCPKCIISNTGLELVVREL